MRLGIEVATRVGIRLSVRAHLVPYMIPEDESSASMYSAGSTFSHVLVQGRVRRVHRENKTRNNQIECYLLYTPGRTDSLELRRVA